MLLAFVMMLFLSGSNDVNTVPWAVDDVSWDRKLDRISSPLAIHGGTSRRCVWAALLPW